MNHSRRHHLFRLSLLGAAVLPVTTSPISAAVTAGTEKRPAGLSTPFQSHPRRIKQAPFGNEVAASIDHYNRVSPYVANAGLLLQGGLQHAAALGFKTILDLRGADERGVKQERQLAQELGIQRVELPVTARVPSAQQVEAFAMILDDPANYPVLVHCVSSNRSGAIWSLYRASCGVDPWVAIEEGKAAGLASREGAVRVRLQLPAE